MRNVNNRTWLLLRGLTRESRHWGSFVQRLKHARPNDKVYCLDLPGTGNNLQDESPNSIAEIVHWLRNKATELGYTQQQKLTLLTLSLGGMVGWEWYRNHPEDVEGIVLINSSFAGLSPFYRRMRWQCLLKLSRITMTKNVAQRERIILQLVSQNAEKRRQLEHDWIVIQTEKPVSFQTAYRQLYAAANYLPTRDKPECSILILNSAGDRLVDPLCSHDIGRQFNLPVYTHPWAGHDITLDDPDWVIQQLSNWPTRV